MTQYTVRFQQHIRTSSRVRRGYRTYQHSASLDQEADEKISNYCVYIPTLYTEDNLPPESYPELFLFFPLDDHRKVICKSVYIGPDRHSYPPRSGNYISHALVCSSLDILNPVEIYENYNWKTGAQVAQEDDQGNVPELVEPATLSTDITYNNKKWFQFLIGDETELSETTSPDQDLIVRQNMLLQAVDAILNKRQLVIIDKREMLLKWTMCLLQCFPPEYVFNHVSIASFANSGLLLEVCGIVCVEAGYEERMRRHFEKAEVIDFFRSVQYQPSEYASALLSSIKGENYHTFRETVFAAITRHAAYSTADFNAHAQFFIQLEQISEMPEEAFKSFFSAFAKYPDYRKSMLQEIISRQLSRHCPVVWKVLLNENTPSTSNFQYYRELALYNIPGLTDYDWLAFELETAQKISFPSIDAVNAFMSITKISDSSRDNLYASLALPLIWNIDDLEQMRHGAEQLLEKLKDPEPRARQNLDELFEYIQLADTINKSANVKIKYQTLLDVVEKVDGKRFEKLARLLPVISWKMFFQLLPEAQNSLSEILKIPALRSKLPDYDMAAIIIARKIADNPGELLTCYQQLPLTQKQEFTEAAPASLFQLLSGGLDINSIEDLNSALGNFPGIASAPLIDKLIQKVKKRQDYDSLWKLCSIVHLPDPEAVRYSFIKNRVDIHTIKQAYALLDYDDVQIPSKYQRLACDLERKNFLKRKVPKTEMLLLTETLDSIELLPDIKKVKKVLKENPLNCHILCHLVKIPWFFLCWQMLFENLSKEKQNQLPWVLKELLDNIIDYENGITQIYGMATYRRKQWESIISQYFVYIILADKDDHMGNLVQAIELNWDDYDFILRQLGGLISKHNNTYSKFHNPSNSKKSGGLFGKSSNGPRWQ